MPLLRKAGDVPKKSLWQRIKDIALTDVGVVLKGGVDAGSLEQLEEVLLQSDFGVPMTLRLVDQIGGYAQAARAQAVPRSRKRATGWPRSAWAPPRCSVA